MKPTFDPYSCNILVELASMQGNARSFLEDYDMYACH